MTQMISLPGAPTLPSYLWRAPRWTHAHRFPVFYNDHGMLLLECALLDELEPDLQVWEAARRGQPFAPPPVHVQDESFFRDVGPKELLEELDEVRAEVRAVLHALSRPIRARQEGSRLWDELSKQTVDFWAEHLGRDPALVNDILLETRGGRERIERVREALGKDAPSPALQRLAKLERLAEEHDEACRAAEPTDEEVELDHYARGELCERVYALVRYIHSQRPHPVERRVPRTPPCEPQSSPQDGFVLPISALRLMHELVRDLAEIDAFLATGRLPRAEDYLPPPEERFATLVRARDVLCATLERGAALCVEYEEAVAHRSALDELDALCIELASRCELPALLARVGEGQDPASVFDLAADLLIALHTSEQPFAPEARARLGVAMALTPRGSPPKAELDYSAMRLSAEERALVREAQFALYGELPDDLLR